MRLVSAGSQLKFCLVYRSGSLHGADCEGLGQTVNLAGAVCQGVDQAIDLAVAVQDFQFPGRQSNVGAAEAVLDGRFLDPCSIYGVPPGNGCGWRPLYRTSHLSDCSTIMDCRSRGLRALAYGTVNLTVTAGRLGSKAIAPRSNIEQAKFRGAAGHPAAAVAAEQAMEDSTTAER